MPSSTATRSHGAGTLDALLHLSSEAAPAAGDAPGEATTLVALLRHRARTQPDDVAFEFLKDGERRSVRLSYAALDRRARHVAAVLQAYGAQDEPALLHFGPGIDFVVTLFGCLYAGVIAVPTCPRHDGLAGDVERILLDAGAACVLTSEASRDEVAAQLAGHGVAVIAPLSGLHCLAERWTPPAAGGDAVALLHYAAGATGAPRGVMLTHANLLHGARVFSQACGTRTADTVLSWLPPQDDLGLLSGILQPLHAGCRSVLLSPAHVLERPVRWLRAISRHRATISGGPGFAYDLCLREVPPAQRVTLELSSWRIALMGGAPAQPRTLRQFSAAFAPFGFDARAASPCYGLAEASGMVAGGSEAAPVMRCFDAERLDAGRVRAASPAVGRVLAGSGRAHAGHDVRIVNPRTRTTCADDEVGEIWVSGAGVAAGYWRRPAETARTFRADIADAGEGPFLRTGDLGFLLDGELFVAGRLDERLVVDGRGHAPHDVEEIVGTSHEALRPGAVAAFVVPVDGDDALVVACEVQRSALHTLQGARRGAEIALAVRTAVAMEFGLYPLDVVLLRPFALPRTSGSTVHRRACRQRYLDGSLAAATAGAAADQASRRCDDVSAGAALLPPSSSRERRAPTRAPVPRAD